ncbi:hypothetical protein [Streptomyces sp. MUM 16J]|uniref:hypothetical protein n=1 Tax=Streptomyces sp. MUM 16J TaxID=2791988 RepID=UPI001F049F25|nr:hypothetical protein [Streptomyces sp. MUM 16J]MCH0560970.1 hypothetical protein [Streptomyces sp. MUM 16J]
MAIAFELVVNFGDNLEAAQAAILTDPKPKVLHAGAHRIPLHRPILRNLDSYIELSILPVAVSWHCGLDGSLPMISLTAAELTELGQQLYDLLQKFDGYVAAKVGWDPESLVSPLELKNEWSEELNEGSLHGIVLCERLHGELGLSSDYAVFRPGYRWIPYRGEEPSGLTAD